MSAVHSVPKVAMLALLLREAAVYRHDNPEAVLDDLISAPEYVSLATLSASELFGETEWMVCQVLGARPVGWAVVGLAGDLAKEGKSLLAEATLHAQGDKGKRTRAQWAEPYMNRWHRVRAAIAAYEAKGIATAFGDLSTEADEAYMTAMGLSRYELRKRFPRPEPEPLPACVGDEFWDG